MPHLLVNQFARPKAPKRQVASVQPLLQFNIETLQLRFLSAVFVPSRPRIYVVASTNIRAIRGASKGSRLCLLAHFCLVEIGVSCCLGTIVVTDLIPESLAKEDVLLLITVTITGTKLFNVNRMAAYKVLKDQTSDLWWNPEQR